ncbi:DIS3-like exonuclease 2 isoform X2 [Ixodes scapularis]
MEREPAVDGAAEQESPGAAQVKQGLGQLTLETPGAKGARRDAKNPRAKNKGKRQQQQPEERGRLSLSDPGNLRCAPPLTQCPALSSRSPAAAGSSRIPVASGPSSPSSSVWVPRDRAGSDPRREPLLPEGLRAQHASHRCRRPGARV